MFQPLKTIVLDNSGNNAIAVAPVEFASLLAGLGITGSDGHQIYARVVALTTNFVVKVGPSAAEAVASNTITASKLADGNFLAPTNVPIEFNVKDASAYVSAQALTAASGLVYVTFGYKSSY